MAKTERWSDEVRTEGSEPQRRFFLSYRPVIAQIAYQVASGLPPAVDMNDLISDGTIGLIKAIGTYDPGRKVQFSSYAEGRIRGAILDGLRGLDWMPRSLRRTLRAMETARSDISQDHGRAPTMEEIAEEMDLSLEDLHDLMAVVAPGSTPRSGGFPGPTPPLSPDDIPGQTGEDPQSTLLQAEMNSGLVRSLASLPERDRTVLTLYYFGEMNLKEIGAYLGVSESRICQIHGRAMIRLRKAVIRLLSFAPQKRLRPQPRRHQEVS